MSVAIGSKFLLGRENKTRADIEDWTTAWGYIEFMVKFKALHMRKRVLDSQVEVVGRKHDQIL